MDASNKLKLKSSFQLAGSISSVYTGGSLTTTSDHERLISTTGEDILVLDLSNGKEMFRLKGDTESMTCFAVKPNDTHLVCANTNLLLKLWDLSTGKFIRQWKAHEAPVLAMDYDPTSTLLATGSADSTIKVWDTDGGYCTHNFKGHKGVVSTVKFHTDKMCLQLFSGGVDTTVRVWDLVKRSCIAVLENHVSVVRSLAISADGLLLSAGRDKIITAWNIKNKKIVKTIPVYESIESIVALPIDCKIPGTEKVSSNLCVVGGEKGLAKIYDVSTGECVQELQEPYIKYQISSLLYNKAKRTLCVVTTDHNLLFYNIDNEFRRYKQIIGHNDEVIDICYVGEEERHVVVATNSEQIRIFELEGYSGEIVYGHTDVVFCFDRSADGTLLVSGSKDNTARVWRILQNSESKRVSCECISLLTGHNAAIGAVGISCRSTSFVLTASQDHTVKYWDISSLSLSLGTITTESNNTSDLYKPKSRYTVKSHEKDINSLAVAPNDKIFATGSQDRTARIWNTADGSLLGTCKGHKRGVWCTQFSPVDQVLATSSGDMTIKIWNMNDYSCLKTFEGHTNSVLKFSFITSGTQIISSGSDGLVKLWTIKTNECVTTMDNHTDKVWALTVSKDEETVITGGADSVISLWHDSTIADEDNARQKDEDRIIKEQDLSNFLAKKDYKNAILLAMSLEQPHRLRRIFEDVQQLRSNQTAENITGSVSVDAALASFTMQEVEKLLRFVRDWNTKTQSSHVAQTVLHVLVRSFSPEKLLQIQAIKELLDGLIPYTQRHYARLDNMVTKSFIMDYTLQAMDILTPDMIDVNGEDNLDMQLNGKRKMLNAI